jgi:hypothetical protein
VKGSETRGGDPDPLSPPATYPQVPSAFTGPHSHVGQQLIGSVPVCLAHAHAGAAHDVVGGGGMLASHDRAHTGQVYVGQQVFGSMPVEIGICPFGHTWAIAGHVTAARSHVGFWGTHWPAHVRPLHEPLASQTQLVSLRSHAHMPGGNGGTSMPVAGSVVVVVGVPAPTPPGVHDHSRHATSHSWPIGQSEFAWQPVCGTLGTQMP